MKIRLRHIFDYCMASNWSCKKSLHNFHFISEVSVGCRMLVEIQVVEYFNKMDDHFQIHLLLIEPTEIKFPHKYVENLTNEASLSFITRQKLKLPLNCAPKIKHRLLQNI